MQWGDNNDSQTVFMHPGTNLHHSESVPLWSHHRKHSFPTVGLITLLDVGCAAWHTDGSSCPTYFPPHVSKPQHKNIWVGKNKWIVILTRTRGPIVCSLKKEKKILQGTFLGDQPFRRLDLSPSEGLLVPFCWGVLYQGPSVDIMREPFGAVRKNVIFPL